jgi:hypothetical protein
MGRPNNKYPEHVRKDALEFGAHLGALDGRGARSLGIALGDRCGRLDVQLEPIKSAVPHVWALLADAMAVCGDAFATEIPQRDVGR